MLILLLILTLVGRLLHQLLLIIEAFASDEEISSFLAHEAFHVFVEISKTYIL